MATWLKSHPTPLTTVWYVNFFPCWIYSETICQINKEDMNWNQFYKLDVLAETHYAVRRFHRSYFIYHSHLGVYPVQFPLGKHLLIAGPIIAYPGLQKYQTYCPAQWFSLWITTAELFGLPGSPHLGKTRKQPRQLNWFWSSTSCLRLTMLKKESCMTQR